MLKQLLAKKPGLNAQEQLDLKQVSFLPGFFFLQKSCKKITRNLIAEKILKENRGYRKANKQMKEMLNITSYQRNSKSQCITTFL